MSPASSARFAWMRRAPSLLLLALFGLVKGSLEAAEPPGRASELLHPQGNVEILRAGTTAWTRAMTNAVLNIGDIVRTGAGSRAAIRLTNESIVRMDERSLLRIQPPREQGRRPVMNLIKGVIYFFHRDRPVDAHFDTPLVSGAIRGTEFNLAVEENGRTVLALLDGEVELSNASGALRLSSGEQAVIEPGQAPVRTALVEAVNVIQWCLYYPAVVDPDELKLGAGTRAALADSLAAYRSGDLIQALAAYPSDRVPTTDGEEVYYAALLLSAGQVRQAEMLLGSFAGDRAAPGHLRELREALRTLIAAVRFEERTSAAGAAQRATEWLAESYYLQAHLQLDEALVAAQTATELSPRFGFAWARLAELEFSFGHTAEALAAVEQAVDLSPRNAQAHAVRGFLLAAQSKLEEAIASFDRAIAIDAALANGWLGRGLCRIRRRDLLGGRDDLLVAAALEPNRALLRSYLGKAFSETRDDRKAAKEFALAKQLDPNDPTAWLYSALLNQQRNRINEAIRDLERSQELNNNRQLYRSRLLLDQDRAVRSANLASLYQDAGLTDVSVREAVRAVNADYANYSAHFFLANSYAPFTDPSQGDLRYETVAFSEYLLGNLLAPVGATTLSPYVTQQEYSKLFERDGPGLASSTEYFSSGDWRQRAVQYGTFRTFSYALDVVYASQNGWRPNNDFSVLSYGAAVKQQLTPQDMVFVQGIFSDFSSGDLRQYFDQRQADRNLRVKELQQPNLFAGLHHQWDPSSHTLLLAGRLQDDFRLTTSGAEIQTVRKRNGVNSEVTPAANQWRLFDVDQHAEFVAYSAELQQIWQRGAQTFIVGGRYQDGETDTRSALDKLSKTNTDYNVTYPTNAQRNSTDLQRLSIYGYYHWQVFDTFWLVAGLSYDRLRYPENIDLPPISDRQKDKDRVSPKAGFIWNLPGHASVRGAYTRSLGGLYYDNSVRLEPTHVAGFIHAWRNLIPESVSGLAAGAEFETWGLELEKRFGRGTYLGLRGELLESHARRTRGVYDLELRPVPQNPLPSGTPERLDFREKSLVFTFNQLLGREWSLGARYQLSVAELDDRLTALDAGQLLQDYPQAIQENRATRHELRLFGNFNHASGFYAHAQAIWNAQSNHGYSPDRPGDDFWHFNVFAGYRFPRRQADITVGLLNIADQDYRLNPLNLYPELPRERTLIVRLRFNF